MSKVKMMSATYKKKGALVPRLRFPEFRDAGEWDCAQMGDIYAFKKNNSFSRDMLNYNAGDVKNIHYGDIHKKFSSHFYAENENIPFVNCNINLGSISEDCLCTAGDIIFADASEDMKDIGKCIEIISNNKERILSGLHTIFTRQFSSTLVIGFGGHLFQSPRVRAQIQKEAQGTKILGISSGRLAKISISFPFAKGEQQKIADCLSSLDERIAAETNKLDALKAHKKGLLKQLFPAEGETTPELRFPEFRGAGEWEEKKLGELANIAMCKRILSKETNEKSGVPFFKIGTIGGMPDAFISKELFRKYRYTYNYPKIGEILITCSGTVGKIIAYDGQDAYYQDSNIVWIDNGSGTIVNQFLYYFLEKFNWKKLNTTTITRIYGDDLRNILLIFPTAISEQQRIADCLSSLDELITAQTQKIDLLKDHKKGLMQQLFPRIDEVRA